MARFKVGDYLALGCSTYPIASSWQVALDDQFTQIIDQTIEDKDNITEWNSPLPKIGQEGFYADLDELHVRVKYHVGNGSSEWFVLSGVGNQNDQEVIVTYEGEIIDTFNSLEAGIH